MGLEAVRCLFPEAKPQGVIPTLKEPGPKVNVFADKLNARWIEVPNGDVLVSEAMSHGGPPRSVYDYTIVATMRRSKATDPTESRCCAIPTATASSRRARSSSEIVNPIEVRILPRNESADRWVQTVSVTN